MSDLSALAPADNHQQSEITQPADGGSFESAELVKGIDDKKRIAQLEHEIFTVCKQLDEKCETLKATQQQNAILKDQLSTYEQEKLQKAHFLDSLVQSRDNLIVEKTELQNEKLSLERKKDEFELQISKLTNDKRRHLEELDQLRKQCDSLLADKSELQSQIDDFQSEKVTIAYDKEQWSREREILLMSKQWYMNEISDREQKTNEIRIQMIREKSEIQREIATLSQANNELQYKTEQLAKDLSERENEYADVQEKFRKALGEHGVRVNEFEVELRTRERLTNVYKEAAELAEKELNELRETEKRLNSLVDEREEALQNLTKEMEALNNENQKTIEEKEAEIKKLSEEVTKATELLNAGFRLNRPDEELIRLSPAAAAASSLLKSGMSLTAIYAEHCRVVSELEKKNAEFKQLERYVTDLIKELDAKAPKFQEQRKAYENISEKNECLMLQNELLGKERQKLQSNSDSLLRELTFTKKELERYQREHHLLKAQVQRLLYIIEKGPDALDHRQMSGDTVSDEYLFSNIRELHSRNVELAEELDRLREEQEKVIENYHNSEIENLKQSLSQAQEELDLLRKNFSKQELLVRELTEQRDQYKNLYDQSAQVAVASSNASTASEGTQQPHRLIDGVHADIEIWKGRAERLQETLNYLNDDRQTHERILNQRIDQQLEQISSMRTTIGKLESDLEFQNKNQQLLAKQIDSYNVDLKRSNDQLSDAKRQLETLQFKYDSLTEQILEKQQDLSSLKVQNHSLTEQLSIVTSREQRQQTELEILRKTRYNAERVSLTLQEVEVLLKRVEAEKAHATESQLQSALLERDNFRQLVDSSHEQHNQLVNGLKINLNTIGSEREKLQMELKSLQTQYNALENLYEKFKQDNEKLRNEMEQVQSTDTNVEACKKEIQKLKNTLAYQEKQIAEFEHKCEELNKTIERKDNQLEEICRLGTDMESSLQYGTMERQRMQAVREQLESDLRTSKSTIEELRNVVASKEMELLSQAKMISEANNKLEEINGSYQEKILLLEKENHESKLQIEHLVNELDIAKGEAQNNSEKCKDLSEQNLRLTTDLAKEISKTEELSRKIAELTTEFDTEAEKFRRSLDTLEQEKLTLQDEIKSYMKRDEDNIEKQDMLSDEIQKLIQQIAFMERLQNTISSPASTNLNLSSISTTPQTPNTTRLSLSMSTVTGESGQNHADRLNMIIGYMRTEKQKETELRMNAELELQRIRAQTGIDHQKIVNLESENSKLRTEVEINANAASEKEMLISQLNILSEVQSRYQQAKKALDDITEQYTTLKRATEDLQQQQIRLEGEKKDLETRLTTALKEAKDRALEGKSLRDRCERALVMLAKCSPETVNSLQGDNEKLRSDISQREKEISVLKKESERLSDELGHAKTELSSVNVKYAETTTSLQQVRTLARKIRDDKNIANEQNVKLQAEVKNLQKEIINMRENAPAAAAPLTSTPVSSQKTGLQLELQKKIQELTKDKEILSAKVVEFETEREQLMVQMDGMQREIDDSAEKVMRIEMIEKSYKNCQQKVHTLSAQIKQMQKQNAEEKQMRKENTNAEEKQLQDNNAEIREMQDQDEHNTEEIRQLQEDDTAEVSQLQEDNIEIRELQNEEDQLRESEVHDDAVYELDLHEDGDGGMGDEVPIDAGAEAEGIDMGSLEEEELGDEDGEGDEDDEDEEGIDDEEGEGDHEFYGVEDEEEEPSLETGEPPRKQRRVSGDQPNRERGEGNLEAENGDNDDDDDIQLL